MIRQKFVAPFVLITSGTPHFSHLHRDKSRDERSPNQLQRKVCRFTLAYNSTEVIVSFALRHPERGDKFRMKIVNVLLNKVCAVVDQPFYTFEYMPGQYEVHCTVFSGKSEEKLKNPPMINYVSYCKKNPDMLMTFKCGDELIHTVTSIMCSLSPVVEAMMKTDCIESQTKSVNVPDYPPKTVRLMVEFCETNNIVNSEGSELSLCDISNFFNIEPLKKFSADLVMNLIDEDNLMQIFQFSQTHDNEDLTTKCLKFASLDLKTAVANLDYSNVDAEVVKSFWEAMKGFESRKRPAIDETANMSKRFRFC